ncbi:MAG: DegT/DnrJ/EryC1/StrS family aminotransferase [Saprospiraceae bacterium]|nr:DegT/DnrJ/EryC1/StrS family aminotransferase [Saprospiraceae bacterium]
MVQLPMVDLKKQFQSIKAEIDREMQEVLESAIFIGGPKVNAFREQLETYLQVKHVIPCANGTDALQIAMMAIGLKPGDEVIVPAFTYVATAEVIGLLGLTPVMTDVDPETFNITPELIEAAITPKTKAIVPVHLFGQCADMEAIMALAAKHQLWVIEDNAQAIGADYKGNTVNGKSGTLGHIGCTSFFPSKNLGCYGDGGAITTNDDDLAYACRMIANHGQSKQYYHDMIGVNSRLDAMQAGVLNVKLPHLDRYNAARQRAAEYYDQHLGQLPQLLPPGRSVQSTHVFHQYTLRLNVPNPREVREALKAHLQNLGIPMMVYYPVPLYDQPAFNSYWKGGTLPVTEQLCATVFSLPMHSELDEDQLKYICEGVRTFFK